MVLIRESIVSRKYPRYKLALLTGGSSGIGLAIARLLVLDGTSVILLARRPEMLAGAKAELEKLTNEKTSVEVAALDVSDPLAVKSVIAGLLEKNGVPDFLYNGAGIAYPHHFESISNETFKSVVDINLGGTWNILSAVVPGMKAEGRGVVVNVSSISGLVGTYGYTAYAASKFAIVGLSQSLRNEMKPEGVDVRVLCPPDTDTPQLAQEEETKPDETRRINGNAGVMSPEAVAKALMKGLRGRSFLILPGFMGKLTWWLYRFFPSLVHFLIDSDVRAVRKADNQTN